MTVNNYPRIDNKQTAIRLAHDPDILRQIAESHEEIAEGHTVDGHTALREMIARRRTSVGQHGGGATGGEAVASQTVGGKVAKDPAAGPTGELGRHVAKVSNIQHEPAVRTIRENRGVVRRRGQISQAG